MQPSSYLGLHLSLRLPDEGLDLLWVLAEPRGLDTAGDIEAERRHVAHGDAGVLGREAAREEERYGGGETAGLRESEVLDAAFSLFVSCRCSKGLL